MSLDSQQVLTAAFKILDNYGLQDLSMRRIGEVLGVRAGALYYHWANKQSLLAAMAEQILTDVSQSLKAIETAKPSPSWEAHTVAWAKMLRQELLKHRDSADLVATTRAMGLVQVDIAQTVVASLLRAGVDESLARAAVLVLVRFVLGHVAEEQAADLSRRLGGTTDTTDVVDEKSFQFGVELLVAGISAQVFPAH